MLKVCPMCGKEFEANRTWRKYCSDECAHSAKLKADKLSNQRRHKGFFEIKTCPVCGHEFALTASHRKYCSKECAKEAKREKMSQWYGENKEKHRKAMHERYMANKITSKAVACCKKHGGIDNCPYEDCIRD